MRVGLIALSRPNNDNKHVKRSDVVKRPAHEPKRDVFDDKHRRKNESVYESRRYGGNRLWRHSVSKPCRYILAHWVVSMISSGLLKSKLKRRKEALAY